MRSQGGAASGGVPWTGHQNEDKVKEEILGLSSVIVHLHFFQMHFFQNAPSLILHTFFTIHHAFTTPTQ